MVKGSRQWHEKLPLLGYRTTICMSVGDTSYSLVFGIEVVIPTKVEIPSVRIIVEGETDDDEWIRTQLDQLSLIDEKRLTSTCHGQLYQKIMAQAYNKKVCPKCLEEGQLVLRCILPPQVEVKGKFSPNWEVPFIVKKV